MWQTPSKGRVVKEPRRFSPESLGIAEKWRSPVGYDKPGDASAAAGLTSNDAATGLRPPAGGRRIFALMEHEATLLLAPEYDTWLAPGHPLNSVLLPGDRHHQLPWILAHLEAGDLDLFETEWPEGRAIFTTKNRK